MVEIDRTELVKLAEERKDLEFCQYGVHMDPTKRNYGEERMCHYCQQSYCGIEEDELQRIADKFGIGSRELIFGTEEERNARRKANGEV